MGMICLLQCNDTLFKILPLHCYGLGNVLWRTCWEMGRWILSVGKGHPLRALEGGTVCLSSSGRKIFREHMLVKHLMSPVCSSYLHFWILLQWGKHLVSALNPGYVVLLKLLKAVHECVVLELDYTFQESADTRGRELSCTFQLQEAVICTQNAWGIYFSYYTNQILLNIYFRLESWFRLSQNIPKYCCVSLYQICRVFELKFPTFLTEINVMVFLCTQAPNRFLLVTVFEFQQ